MKRVRAGFGNHVHDGAGVPPVLRVERIGDDAKFFDRIRRRLDGRQIREEVVAVAAVHGIVVGAAAAAVDGDDAGFVGTIEGVVAELRLYARLKLQKLIYVALVQRQLRRGALVDDSAELRTGRINDRRSAGDFHRFSGRAKLQRDIHADDFVEVERNSLAHVLLETFHRHIDFVRADGHLEQQIFAAGSGLDIARYVRRLIDERHLRTHHSAAARIADCAADAAAGALRRDHRRKCQRCDCQNRKEKQMGNAECEGIPPLTFGLHQITPQVRYRPPTQNPRPHCASNFLKNPLRFEVAA